jgi:hypothetical protein
VGTVLQGAAGQRRKMGSAAAEEWPPKDWAVGFLCDAKDSYGAPPTLLRAPPARSPPCSPRNLSAAVGFSPAACSSLLL